MINTPIKECASARGPHALPERTAATELPLELTKLSDHAGLFDVNCASPGVGSPAPDGGKRKDGHQAQTAKGSKAGEATVITSTGFMDDSHPTIFAPTRTSL